MFSVVQVEADAATVALFVLGSPPTLQIADIRTGQVDVLAQGLPSALSTRSPRTNGGSKN